MLENMLNMQRDTDKDLIMKTITICASLYEFDAKDAMNKLNIKQEKNKKREIIYMDNEKQKEKEPKEDKYILQAELFIYEGIEYYKLPNDVIYDTNKKLLGKWDDENEVIVFL